MVLKMPENRHKSCDICNFNFNRGGVLESNYTIIRHIHITETKKYLDFYTPGDPVYLVPVYGGVIK